MPSQLPQSCAVPTEAHFAQLEGFIPIRARGDCTRASQTTKIDMFSPGMTLAAAGSMKSSLIWLACVLGLAALYVFHREPVIYVVCGTPTPAGMRVQFVARATAPRVEGAILVTDQGIYRLRDGELCSFERNPPAVPRPAGQPSTFDRGQGV